MNPDYACEARDEYLRLLKRQAQERKILRMLQKLKRGPGRPKKDGGRSAVLQAKCSPEVKDLWQAEAARRGIPLSDLVAEIAKGFPT